MKPAIGLILPCFLLLVALALWAFGCGDEQVRAEDYNQSCRDSSDCVTVVSGSPCDCQAACGAINRDDEAAYQRDSAAIPGCGFSVTPSCDGQSPEQRCSSRIAVCDGGLCQID